MGMEEASSKNWVIFLKDLLSAGDPGCRPSPPRRVGDVTSRLSMSLLLSDVRAVGWNGIPTRWTGDGSQVDRALCSIR